MTVSEVIYYTGVHPYTLKPIYTAKGTDEKKNQNRFFFWYKRENRDWIKDRLTKAKRPELISQLLGDQHGQTMNSGNKSSGNKTPNNVPNWLSERRKKK